MRTFLLLLAAVPLLAQQLPYFDLSSGWTLRNERHPGEQVTLPFSSVLPAEHYIVQRNVDLPAGVDVRTLSLVLPAMYGAYRLRVNGMDFGGPGEIQSARTPLPWPYLYRLERLPPTPTLAIEIEVWRAYRYRFSPALSPAPNFPVLAVTRIAENELAGRIGIARVSRMFLAMVGAFSVLIFSIVAILASRAAGDVAWWLAGSIFCSALTQLLGYTGTGLGWPDLESNLFLFGGARTISQVAMVEFGLRYSGCLPRWRWAVYIVDALLEWGLLPLPAFFRGYWSCVLLLAPCLIRYWNSRAAGVRLVLGTVTLLYALVLIPAVTTGGLFVPAAPVFRMFLYAGLVLMLIRRAVADRAERLRLTGELVAARQVQNLLVGAAETQVAGFAIETVYTSAQEVGGDFYLVQPVAEGALLAVVGDVSGKGLKAAMVVSLVIGALRNRHSDQPAAVLGELNNVLAGQIDGGFVTCVVVRLQPSGEGLCANAGHLAPYADGQELDVPAGLPLGVVSEAEYEQAPVSVRGQLTLLSDGVVEAANGAGELFGFERTRAIAGKSAAEIAGTAQNWGQNDDITVVTVSPQRKKDI